MSNKALHRNKKGKKKDSEADRQLAQAFQHFKQGDINNARQICQSVLLQNPSNAKAYFLMGNIAESMGDIATAINYYNKTIELDPREAAYCFRIGDLYKKARQFEKAASFFREGINREPTNATAHYLLGEILLHLRNQKEAVKSFTQAINLKNNFYEAHQSLAIIYEEMNELEKADNTVSNLEKIAPELPYTLYIRAKLHRRNDNFSEALELLEKLIEKNPDDIKLRTTIFHEAGKCCEKLQRYDQAFEYFSEAQKLSEQYYKTQFIEQNNQLSVFERVLEATDKWFDKDIVSKWEAVATEQNENISEAPVFIVGFPRSGTTLTDRILSSHPALHVLEEKDLMMEMIPELGAITGKQKYSYPEILADLSEDDIQKARDLYLKKLEQHGAANSQNNGKRLIDKMPLNIIHLGFIYRLFPEARVIVLLRDPRDVCFSCFTQFFEHNSAMQHFYTLDNTIKMYARVMDTYFKLKEIIPLKIHELRYESLVSDTENECRKLLSFIGEEWNDSVLRFYENKTEVHTPSYESVSKPIYTSSSEKWKNYAKYFDKYQKPLEHIINTLNYK